MKTIRETMKEKGVLKDFLKTHKYDPGQKYRFGNFGDFSVLYEPIAYMDVSLNTHPHPHPRHRAEGSVFPPWSAHSSSSLLWRLCEEPGEESLPTLHPSPRELGDCPG